MDRVLAKAVNGEITMKSIDLCRRASQKKIIRNILGLEAYIYRGASTVAQVNTRHEEATIYIHGDSRDYSRTFIQSERALGIYLVAQKIVSENDVEWGYF